LDKTVPSHTVEEVLANIHEAIELYLETLTEEEL
jgi:predicted RNase H-like HicB family nuclease